MASGMEWIDWMGWMDCVLWMEAQERRGAAPLRHTSQLRRHEEGSARRHCVTLENAAAQKVRAPH